MVIDPFGQIIAERTETGPGLLMARIHHHHSESNAGEGDMNYTEHVRATLPIESSRRHDIFPLSDAGTPVRMYFLFTILK